MCDVCGGGIAEDDLALREAAREEGSRRQPALDALLEQFGDAAITVHSHDADANVLVAAEIEECVEKGLFGLVAEGRKVVQYEEQWHVANLRLL